MVNNKIRSKSIEEIARFLYHGFIIVQKYSDLAQVTNYIRENSHRVVYVVRDNEIVGAAVFLTLTDQTFYDLKYGRLNLKDPETMKCAGEEVGRNIHFFAVHADSMRTIMLGLRDVVKSKKPITVSWFNPKGKLCVRHTK